MLLLERSLRFIYNNEISDATRRLLCISDDIQHAHFYRDQKGTLHFSATTEKLTYDYIIRTEEADSEQSTKVDTVKS